MSENIIQKAIRRIRPGSGGGPAKAISIIDGSTGRSPDTFGIRQPTLPSDEDFDDMKSGAPLALSTQFGVMPDSSPFPTGVLDGTDKSGNIPYHAPDDPAVLWRLFGLKGMADD